MVKLGIYLLLFPFLIEFAAMRPRLALARGKGGSTRRAARGA
jgi:hypothetical protein